MKGVYICVPSSVQNGFLNDPSPKETVDFRTKNNKEMYSFDKGGGRGILARPSLKTWSLYERPRLGGTYPYCPNMGEPPTRHSRMTNYRKTIEWFVTQKSLRTNLISLL